MLAFCVAGVVYLADAVGTQTEAVVVRGLSIGVAMQQVAWRELQRWSFRSAMLRTLRVLNYGH